MMNINYKRNDKITSDAIDLKGLFLTDNERNELSMTVEYLDNDLLDQVIDEVKNNPDEHDI